MSKISRTPNERKSNPDPERTTGYGGEGKTNPSARNDRSGPTYQDVLDEALVETFPASDPISPGTAARRDRPISTPKNPKDWVQPNGGSKATSHVFTKPPQELQQAQQPQPANTTRPAGNGAAAATSGALTPERVQQLRAQLEARARELVNEMRALEEERPETPTLTQTTVEDMAEHGEQRSRDAVRGAEQDRDAGELRDIAAALARIDEGRYGVCVDCGTEIPLARLKVQPAAMRCLECQERYERAHPPELKAVLMR